MCGLTGVMSSWLTDPEIDRFRELMIVHCLRGRYGSGVIIIPQTKKKSPKYFRSTSNGTTLALSPQFDELVKERPSVIMGHTRAPTTGGWGVGSSHPHKCGHIVGMHNGTMKTVCGQKPKKDVSDSEMLFQAIEQHGIEHAIKESEGSFALTWINTDTKTLHFLRNEDRPLFVAYEKEQNTVYWGSTGILLDTVLGQRLKDIEIVQIKKDTVYTFDMRPSHTIRPRSLFSLQAKGGEWDGLPFGEVKGTNITPLPSTHPVWNPPGTRIGHSTSTTTTTSGDAHVGNANSTNNASQEGPLSENKLKPGEYLIAPKVLHPLIVSTEEMYTRLMRGCRVCAETSNIAAHTLGRVFWVDHNDFVCDECYKHSNYARDLVEGTNLSRSHLH